MTNTPKPPKPGDVARELAQLPPNLGRSYLAEWLPIIRDLRQNKKWTFVQIAQFLSARGVVSAGRTYKGKTYPPQPPTADTVQHVYVRALGKRIPIPDAVPSEPSREAGKVQKIAIKNPDYLTASRSQKLEATEEISDEVLNAAEEANRNPYLRRPRTPTQKEKPNEHG